MSNKKNNTFSLSRRQVIKGGALLLGAVTLGALPAGCSSTADYACTVTPSYTEGPFYVNTGLERSDVTEGLIGAPMRVRLKLLDAKTCTPLEGALVDIWSASSEGIYSGVDNSIAVTGAMNTHGETFMRGYQIADSEGILEFQTLFPGWYDQVAPHFHFTLPFENNTAFTWQFFLDDDFCDEVYTTIAPYNERGVHPSRNNGFLNNLMTPDSLLITPTGTPQNPLIDVAVGIDMDDLGKRAAEYEPS